VKSGKFMTKFIVSWLLGISFLVTGEMTEAQHQAKVTKVGELRSLPAPRSGAGADILRRELSKLGYIEGKNITFETQSAEGKFDRLPALADELVRLKVDLFFTASTNTALAAKNASSVIPVVFVFSGDPIAAGLVDSLARPGGNVTGFTTVEALLAGKRLELLKEMIPKLSRVAFLWDPLNPGSAQAWKESQLPARELGLQLYSLEVTSADKLKNAFHEATRTRSGALVVGHNPLASLKQKEIAELAVRNRLPTVYQRADYVTNGGLMSYGADLLEPYRRGAWIIDKILKGTNPADIPVEQPIKFDLVINLETAKQIALTIPPNVLARADRVIR
jgi:putative tryptophan/tyrosine transport system substrate-binding protein